MTNKKIKTILLLAIFGLLPFVYSCSDAGQNINSPVPYSTMDNGSSYCICPDCIYPDCINGSHCGNNGNHNCGYKNCNNKKKAIAEIIVTDIRAVANITKS